MFVSVSVLLDCGDGESHTRTARRYWDTERNSERQREQREVSRSDSHREKENTGGDSYRESDTLQNFHSLSETNYMRLKREVCLHWAVNQTWDTLCVCFYITSSCLLRYPSSHLPSDIPQSFAFYCFENNLWNMDTPSVLPHEVINLTSSLSPLGHIDDIIFSSVVLYTMLSKNVCIYVECI